MSLPFTEEEYRARLDRVRAGMAQLGVDALLIHSPENTFYLSGLRSLGYSVYQTLLVLPTDPLVFVTREWEALTSVPGTSLIKETRAYGDAHDPITVLVDLVHEKKLEKARIGIDLSSRNLTASQFSEISRLCDGVTFIDASGLVEAVRQIKSEAEIALMRESGRAGEAAMAAWRQALQPGRSEFEIAADVYKALIAAGSEYPGYPPFISTGMRTAWAHATWDRRTLEEDDVAFAELSAAVMRYHAPLTSTVALGRTYDREVSRTEKAVRAALDAGLVAMRAGVECGYVDDLIWSTIEKQGFDRSERNSGYAVGIAFPPTWSEARTVPARASEAARRAGIVRERFFLSRGNTSLLEEGMTFHVLPTILARNRFIWGESATVVVRRTGVELLAGPFRQDRGQPAPS